MTPDLLPDSLRSRITVQEDGCWIWTGGSNQDGYGLSSVRLDGGGRITKGTHRLVYELLVGPIPEGLVIDHLCRVPACQNPAHMEPVTQRENVLRGRSFMAGRASWTHCIHGHEFTPENTYRQQRGRRRCRTCTLARNRTYAANRRQQVAA